MIQLTPRRRTQRYTRKHHYQITPSTYNNKENIKMSDYLTSYDIDGTARRTCVSCHISKLESAYYTDKLDCNDCIKALTKAPTLQLIRSAQNNWNENNPELARAAIELSGREHSLDAAQRFQLGNDLLELEAIGGVKLRYNLSDCEFYIK